MRRNMIPERGAGFDAGQGFARIQGVGRRDARLCGRVVTAQIFNRLYRGAMLCGALGLPTALGRADRRAIPQGAEQRSAGTGWPSEFTRKHKATVEGSKDHGHFIPGMNKRVLQRPQPPQQGRLLNNQSGKVLRSLQPHLEPPDTKEAPVSAAYRYLSERRDCLDYVTARASDLPIGSGEIESGHRHVIQKRLKLAGAWWKQTNAQAMLNLRTARANNQWSQHWIAKN